MISDERIRARTLDELGRMYPLIQQIVRAKNTEPIPLEELRSAAHEIFKAARRLQNTVDAAIAQQERTKNHAGNG